MKIGTWNVRTLTHLGKLDNIKLEMKRLNVNILGMSEVRWKGAGDHMADEYRIIYSGGEEHQRGVAVILDHSTSKCIIGHWPVSDRVLVVKLRGQYFNISLIQVYAPTAQSPDADIENFYEDLDKAKSHCKSQDIVIIMGDFNAKVGEGKFENVVGEYGLGERNERGERFIEWCKANNQIITNTWFKNHPRRRWTWRSPGDTCKNQIDYITINERFRNSITQSKSYPGADCNSDHIQVICNIKTKLRKLRKNNIITYQYWYEVI